MNVVKEYTDMHYASKQEVASFVGRHLSEPVWNQIAEYRKQFFISCADVDFCLCPGILRKILNFQEMMMIKKSDVEDNLMLSEQYRWLLNHFKKTKGDSKKRLHDVCMLFANAQESKITDVMSLSVPAICKIVWILISFDSYDFQVLLCALFANEYGMSELLSLLKPADFTQCCLKDGTYALSAYLDRWMTDLKTRLLKEENDEIDYDHMIYQYPQLKPYQIEFYLAHHEPGFYYTIEQFIEYTDVCYETGRSALRQMSEMGFYQMLKQGKKFVYTAR